MVLKWDRTHSDDSMEVQLSHRLKGALQEPLALPALVFKLRICFLQVQRFNPRGDVTISVPRRVGPKVA